MFIIYLSYKVRKFIKKYFKHKLVHGKLYFGYPCCTFEFKVKKIKIKIRPSSSIWFSTSIK